jgi:hypothetical protein
MKILNHIILLFFIQLNISYSQKQYIPPQRLGVDSSVYDFNVRKIKKYYNDFADKELKGSDGVNYHLSIAISYKLLKESNDSIFCHVEESLGIDSLETCKTLKGFREADKHLKNKNRPYNIRGCDTATYDRIICNCPRLIFLDSLKKAQNNIENSKNYDAQLLNILKEIYSDDQKYREDIENARNKYGNKSKEVSDLWINRIY